MQVSYSSLFVCFDLYPRHIAPALMLQRTPPQAGACFGMVGEEFTAYT